MLYMRVKVAGTLDFCVILWSPLALPRSATGQYKTPGVDQIVAELIQAGGNIFWDQYIFKLYLSQERIASAVEEILYLFLRKEVKLIAVFIKTYHSY